MSHRDLMARAWNENILYSALVELTYRCNLDCFFCYNDVGQQGTPLSTDQYDAFLADLAELQTMELILPGGECFCVRVTPREKPTAAIVAQHRQQRGLQRRPSLEYSFGLWFLHTLDPRRDVLGLSFDEIFAGRIRPGIVNLTPKSEITERRSTTEQVGAVGQM